MKKILTLLLIAILPPACSQAGTFNADSVYNALWRQLSVGGPHGANGSGDISGMDCSMTDFYRSLWVVEELASDEFICAWNDLGLPELNTGLASPDNVFLAAVYARHAFGIQTANYYLENAPASLTTRRAEARLLRAYFYMNLIDMFGDVPFTTSSTASSLTGTATAPPKKSRKEICSFIEGELKSCADDLPDDHHAAQYRPDKVAAWLLLARLYLNAGVYTGTPRWADAKLYAQKVIDSQYSLCNNYARLFMGDNDSNGASAEFILPVYVDGKNMQSWGAMTYLIASMASNHSYPYDPPKYKNGLDTQWAGNRLRENLIWKFFPNHDVPNATDTAEMKSAASDDRALFSLNGSDDSSTVRNTAMDKFSYGLECHKFTNVHTTDSIDKSYDGVFFADTDIPLLRKAEAYLIYAEADARLNGDNCSAMGLAAYNTIRQRAHATAASSVSLDDICDEWGREFYGEARRHSDLVRFGKYAGGGYVWPWKGGSYGGTDIDSHYNLYPLPTSVMQTNKDYTQNPGYYDINHVEYSIDYVDLGLSVKWATCNLGASSPEATGNYYAWGETQPKSYYSWRTYKHCYRDVIPRGGDSDSTTIYKYNASDGKNILEASDDAAAVALGGNWRMPTLEDMYELCEYCYWQPATLNGVQGYRIYGPNSNSIFLPFTGYCEGGDVFAPQTENGRTEDKGFYWTSTLHTSQSSVYGGLNDAADGSLHALGIDLGDYGELMDVCERFTGCPIRPVWEEPEEQPSGSIPVAILSTNSDGSTKTLTFTIADASTATAQNGKDGTYRLNVKKRTPGWFESNISKVNFTPAFANARPTTTHSWFEDCDSLETIEGIEYLNTSEVTDMSYMFRYCPMTTIDVSHFDTRNVTDMAAMFEQCHAMQNVDLSGFNTGKVTSMHDMFDYCNSLHYVDVSHFNTSNVVDFGNMFNDSAIDSVDVRGFDTKKAKFLFGMFSGSDIKNLDLSGFSFESTIDATEILNSCGNLISLNVGANDLKGLTFEEEDGYNGEPFEGVGTEENPCKLVINSDFDKSVLGEKISNGSVSYYKWHDGYFTEPIVVVSGIKAVNGINGVSHDNATYNLSGQRVGKLYKGIVINKGRKHIRR